MWARIQEMAIRRETPEPFKIGQTVAGYRIRRRLKPITGFRRYEATRDWQVYELRQFYDVDTNAFLRWQNQARLARLPMQLALVHAVEEWPGGVIIPDRRLPSLAHRLPQSMESRLHLAASLASLIGGMHEAGIVHHDLHPGAVLFKNAETSLKHLGRSAIHGFHDPWTFFAGCRASHFAAPELLCGARGDSRSDVFSFAMLLLYLWDIPAPPRWLKNVLCSWYGGWQSIASRFSPQGLPATLRSPITESMARSPKDRPTMTDWCRILDTTAATIPCPYSPRGLKAAKIMALISPDANAHAIFQRAMQLARDGSSLLFVSLVPVNFAFGELELYKVRLFKTLAKGLREIRTSPMDWGLIIRENVDEATAVRQLCERLEPDLVLCGPASRKGIGARLRPGVGNAVERTGCKLERPGQSRE